MVDLMMMMGGFNKRQVLVLRAVEEMETKVMLLCTEI